VKGVQRSTPVLGVSDSASLDFTGASAEQLLGWRARPARNSIIDAADSLIAAGLV
jgi:hypothetical protein